jgi:hypothetical protein
MVYVHWTMLKCVGMHVRKLWELNPLSRWAVLNVLWCKRSGCIWCTQPAISLCLSLPSLCLSVLLFKQRSEREEGMRSDRTRHHALCVDTLVGIPPRIGNKIHRPCALFITRMQTIRMNFHGTLYSSYIFYHKHVTLPSSGEFLVRRLWRKKEKITFCCLLNNWLIRWVGVHSRRADWSP